MTATGEAMLVEANPRDWIWGVGLSADDPAVHRPDDWKGENLLGRILTDVRRKLG
ncbi:MAG: NADAR domain-containing protein [Caulobacter sp.]